VYSGDTGPEGGFDGLCAGADLVVAEASYQGAQEDHDYPYHLAAATAGAIARGASAGRLMLTHLRPTLDPARSVEEAEATFGRPVELAVPGLETDV
jgi:ribonuclease BN (tRNA processing enzyme)